MIKKHWLLIKLLTTMSGLILLSIADAQVAIPSGDGFFVIPLTKKTTQAIQPSGFDYVLANQTILTGFPVGHNLPQATNELFYNLLLDGYGGLPFGSCLRRGYLLPSSDPDKELCTANENNDLMRVWANRNPNLKNVLLKNMTIKNALRSYVVVDGTVITASSQLPHTDTFQSFYGGAADENPDWLVIQDTLIKNSDTSLMIMGNTKFSGGVYQNLETGCDEAFKQDTESRYANDYAEFFPLETPRQHYPCSNSVAFSSDEQAPVWLIDITTGGRIGIENNAAPVIAIGDNSNDWNISMRADDGKIITHPNIRYYASIEAALQVEGRPPYIEYSCAGWANPPSGCESRSGYFD